MPDRFKNILSRGLTRIEDEIESWRGEHRGTPTIQPYIGYATTDHVIARGRVLALKPEADMRDPSLWNNIRAMGELFLTDEMRGVKITAEGVDSLSDEEGYFTLTLPLLQEGWHHITCHMPGYGLKAELPVMVPDTYARYGIISDIDDTLIKTEAWSLARNIRNTFTGTADSRHVFPDAVSFLSALHKGLNPVFYVSSSPWNIHGFLEQIFERNGLVRGPKFLRDYGLEEDKLITGTHGNHKGAAIETILAANPNLQFILMGDTGQHDPQVYGAVIKTHPDRIKAAIFRSAGGIDAEDMQSIDAIRNMGTIVHAVNSYDELSLAQLQLDSQ